MANQIILVTEPDDVLIDGHRILLIDLDRTQLGILSDTLKDLETNYPIIVYNWQLSHSQTWMIDKKHKSQLLIFNADSIDQTLIGYAAAQPNSYYFGNLRSIKELNNRVLYDTKDCLKIMENQLI